MDNKASNNTFQAATFKVVEIEGLNFKEKWKSRTFLDCANPGSIHLLQTDGKSLDDPDFKTNLTGRDVKLFMNLTH